MAGSRQGRGAARTAVKERDMGEEEKGEGAYHDDERQWQRRSYGLGEGRGREGVGENGEGEWGQFHFPSNRGVDHGAAVGGGGRGCQARPAVRQWRLRERSAREGAGAWCGPPDWVARARMVESATRPRWAERRKGAGHFSYFPLLSPSFA